MAEWWTYGVSDFLMHSPQAWWRLVERYNAAIWPAQGAGLALGATLLGLAGRGAVGGERAGFVIVAVAWCWVAWAFHLRHHAEISIAATGIAAASAVQAALLVAGVFVLRAQPRALGRYRLRSAQALLAAALLYPMAAPASGRPVSQAEVFGCMPDPTALATLGWLLASRRLPAWAIAAAAVMPIASLAWSAAMRWAMAQ